jgi:hypothetical protein
MPQFTPSLGQWLSTTKLFKWLDPRHPRDQTAFAPLGLEKLPAFDRIEIALQKSQERKISRISTTC